MSQNINNISINNFNNLCRTCSQSNDLVPIHENNYLIEMLATSVQIQIQLNDEFPKNICLNCIDQLNQSYAFISKCRTTDAAFKQCLTQQKKFNQDKNESKIKLELTEEIDIKEEYSDIEYNSINDDSKESERQEFVSHLTDCQLTNINEPTKQEGNCNFEFHDMSEDVPPSNLTETSHLSDEDGLTSPDLKEAAKHVDLNLLPNRSKRVYEETYRRFMDYCKDKSIASFSENVLITYFDELSKKIKSSTLWATYSMLRATLNAYNTLDITKYLKLRALLKRQSHGYQPKKSKVLEKEQILKFLLEAPDDTYLATKVALMFGLAGACNCEELFRMKIDDITDMGSKLLITIPQTKKTRSFFVTKHLDIYRKYAALRPIDLNSPKLFYKYLNGEALKQLIGIHKFGTMPQEIAAYLKLPNVKEYTGHCLRRTSWYFAGEL